MIKLQRLGAPILKFFLLLTVAASVFCASVAAQSEAVKYPALRAQMNQWDCDDPKAPGGTFCRVKQMPVAEQIGKRLEGDAGAWSAGDLLTLARRAKADSVEVIVGGAVYPMTPVGGTDFWAVVLKAPRLQSGIVSYRFIVAQGDAMKFEPPKSDFVWRGADAPAAPAQSKILQGRIIEETIQSVNLSETRGLTVYSPPMRKGEKPAVVIYVADGRNVNGLARYVDALIASRKLPPVLLVGVNSADRLRDPNPRVADVRAVEYLIGYGETAERFEKHERFFVEEVVRWAESKYNAPKTREKRGIFGVSNGGAFAIAMGAKHFDTFGHVFGFSNDSKDNLLAPGWSDKRIAPTYYLVAGSWEFRVRDLPAYAEILKQRGAKVAYAEPVAEHDSTMWNEQFVQALLIHFGKNRR